VFGVAASLAACGHVGIDLGEDGSAADGMAGDSSGGSDQIGPASGGGSSSTGGKDAGSDGGTGGNATGGATGSGGATGGQSGVGGTGNGGSGGAGTGGEASGGSAGSGGEAATGGAAGSGGTGGGGTFDCDTSDPLCSVLLGAQAHRYSFDGVGTAASDSLGGESATVVGTALDGSGAVQLTGLFDYVSLPGGLLAPLPNVSFEIWFVWNGGAPWQRFFEFGSETLMGDPITYIYATPEAGGTILPEIALGAGIRHMPGGDRQLRTLAVTQIGVLTHVVLVADDVGDRLTLYKNGAWVAQRDTPVDLNGIQDQTNYLGRSLFDDDPYFDGVITEFRIYGEVLSAEAIEKSYDVGPDATFGP
jgi:hypothetical protein